MAKGKAAQGPIWALGAMSGTSLDGVDAAMVLTDGHSVLDFGPHAYRPYTPAEQSTLRAALGRWPDDPGVAAAAEVVETAHAELLSRFSGAEVAGFHGQTLAHDPRGQGTHQAGSYNKPGYLGFDFNNNPALPPALRSAPEGPVNAAIPAHLQVPDRPLPPDEAQALGSQAMFGEESGHRGRTATSALTP